MKEVDSLLIFRGSSLFASFSNHINEEINVTSFETYLCLIDDFGQTRVAFADPSVELWNAHF